MSRLRANSQDSGKLTSARLLGYSLGECGYSLITNGAFAFAMIYYTETLRLNASAAAVVLAVPMLWGGIMAPYIGGMSDRTRSRLGRRHPWMFVGGLTMALGFSAAWSLPAVCSSSPFLAAGYLLVINLFVRTGAACFLVPYVALGFEMSSDNRIGIRLQAVRQVANMAANFLGPVLAWTWLFRDSLSDSGVRVLGPSLAENFTRMGFVFSAATAILVGLMLWSTRWTIEDTRGIDPSIHLTDMFGVWKADFLDVTRQPDARRLLAFVFIICVGMVFVGSLGIYVYIYFMGFSPEGRSIAHAASMLGMATGAVFSVLVATRVGNRRAVIFGTALSVIGSAALGVIFLGGSFPRWGSLTLVVFSILHGIYWLGNGLMLPLATAMMGDLAGAQDKELNVRSTGRYSAAFSLLMQTGITFGLLLSGIILGKLGFGGDSQRALHPSEALWRLGLAMFLGGALANASALINFLRLPATSILGIGSHKA